MSKPVATSQETVEALLTRSRRKKGVPIRRAFVQGRFGQKPVPGPLADFVRSHDDRALELYLLCRAVASAEPWNVDESALLWARALDLGTTESSLSAVSKAWRRLDKRRLIERVRVKRRASITILREDKTGRPYSHPGAGGEAYFTLPLSFWTAQERWYRKLSLAEMALLLIALSLPNDFYLPFEKGPDWYGISAETVERGLRGLSLNGLLSVREVVKSAPLAPEGFTIQRLYSLQAPFGPHKERQKKVNEPAARESAEEVLDAVKGLAG